MSTRRLDKTLVEQGKVSTRSQAESYVKLRQVTVNGIVITKPGQPVKAEDDIQLTKREQYVSRAALKLDSVATTLRLNFGGKVILDVGSSTGGFTDFALRHGATKVIAVDVGTSQLHPSLHNDPRIELHEQTDIRGFVPSELSPNLILIDVSFISLREILPHIKTICGPDTLVVAMVKPQFETGPDSSKHKGVIKNDKIRRAILKDFENWVQNLFVILDKADSEVTGAKGNRERFYLMRPL